jgi:hypothetical protein
MAGSPRFAVADSRVDLTAGELAILDRDGVVLNVEQSPRLEVTSRLINLVAARLPRLRRRTGGAGTATVSG